MFKKNSRFDALLVDNNDEWTVVGNKNKDNKDNKNNKDIIDNEDNEDI